MLGSQCHHTQLQRPHSSGEDQINALATEGQVSLCDCVSSGRRGDIDCGGYMASRDVLGVVVVDDPVGDGRGPGLLKGCRVG